MKAQRIALVVIEVEALLGEDKSMITSTLYKLFKEGTDREVQIAAMKIFRADEATPS